MTEVLGARPPVRRLKQRADFERVLGAGPAAVLARSPHFVVHFLAHNLPDPAAEAARPAAPARRAGGAAASAAAAGSAAAGNAAGAAPGAETRDTAEAGSGLAAADSRAIAPQLSPELSTAHLSLGTGPVEECALIDLDRPAVVQVGTVLPKRWARRSVTRTLLKRQIFAVADRHAARMPGGRWVVRLRASFDRDAFPSAASAALNLAARTELETLFGQAVARAARQLRGGPSPTP